MSAPSRADAVTDFANQRTNFLKWLGEQSHLIRHQPKPDTLAEVKANLREQGTQFLDQLSKAAITMASEASEHICVIAKPPGFYDVEVPNMCDALQRLLAFLAMRLGVNAKCDMCVHFVIENILAEPGF
ncbi:hypothetical protein N7491_006460 [Penicillium cf. griseofulvum]|uniref:Uncharacterized protein n=1 Tax=Penicillium cf. griseofulvum TaxID=2972120 RepID=A0A9W9IZH9_9EURO|nr:hypothetical protein N7472_010510 [Penicillium cf. griseofulvum]KAJ5429444.1 hypothetical protein N7491_006460 [Penicillium cf. griseofulvum]KAJ5436774.1 hypothetical protein N7445_007659 [Penicillium cf. griseofulvum]